MGSMTANFTAVLVAFALVTAAAEAVIIYIQTMLSGFADVGGR